MVDSGFTRSSSIPRDRKLNAYRTPRLTPSSSAALTLGAFRTGGRNYLRKSNPFDERMPFTP